MADWDDAEILIEGPDALNLAIDYFAGDAGKFHDLAPRETRIQGTEIKPDNARSVGVEFETATGPPHAALLQLRKRHHDHEFTGAYYRREGF